MVVSLFVAYDHQAFSLERYGGISRYHYEIARRVGGSPGFSAGIIAPLYWNAYLPGGGVRVRGLPIPMTPGTGNINEVKLRILRAANRIISPFFLDSLDPDVLHETYYAFHSLAPRGCPTVVTVHDMILEKYRDLFPSGYKTSDAKRSAVNRAARVICVSEHTRKDLVEIFGINKEKTTVIHHGYSLTADSGRNSVNFTGRPFLLYVGERGRYKNFDRFLLAYAGSEMLRGEFGLVAFGGGAFTVAEISRQQGLGLGAGRVRQVSGNDEKLASFYRQASVFVYPSLYEGFGIPPLEAMNFGCPVVCSNTSSVPEVVGDAAYFFDPGDADSIRAAIETVVLSAELREDLVRRGKARLNMFSWDRCAAETMSVYREVAS